MDKTIMQHFEDAVIEGSPQLFSRWPDALRFNLHFAKAIYDESRKCRMTEGHESLLKNACQAFVLSNQDGFKVYFRRMGKTIYWEAKDYENLSKELEALAPRVKGLIQQWLYDIREELYSDYASDLAPFGKGFSITRDENHPVRTFNHWLDYLDYLKEINRIENIAIWFYLKRTVVDVVRVGMAVIPRGER